jgi:hypothetical protein
VNGKESSYKLLPSSSQSFLTWTSTATNTTTIRPSELHSWPAQHCYQSTMATEQSNKEVRILQQSGIEIQNLPYDILYLVFKSSKLGDATCLGLTCRLFYNHLKEYHPRRISLNTCCCNIEAYLDHRIFRCLDPLGEKIEHESLTKGYSLVWRWGRIRFIKEKVFGLVHLDKREQKIQQHELKSACTSIVGLRRG